MGSADPTWCEFAIRDGLVRAHDLAFRRGAVLTLLTYPVPAGLRSRQAHANEVANAFIREVASERGLPLIELSQAVDDAEFTVDGIHLTEAGYRTMAERVADAI
jgi:lysophospholipase L1-like esterase